jgi:hypothetical protein
MYKKMLLGGLLTKGLKAAVASKPYKKFRKEAMDKTAALYKKAPQMDPDRKSLKDKKFMKGLQKLDTQRAKSQKLVDMTQFVLLSARKAGHKSAVREMRKTRRGLASYAKSLNTKAKAMFQRKLKKKKLN